MSDLARVRIWAEALIRIHLDPLHGEGSWTFGFDHAKRRAGLCNYPARRISVSRYLAARFEDDEASPGFLERQPGGQSGRTGTNHGNIDIGHGLVTRRSVRLIRPPSFSKLEVPDRTRSIP